MRSHSVDSTEERGRSLSLRTRRNSQSRSKPRSSTQGHIFNLFTNTFKPFSKKDDHESSSSSSSLSISSSRKLSVQPASPRQFTPTQFDSRRRSSEIDPIDADRGRSKWISQSHISSRSKSPSHRRLKLFPSLNSSRRSMSGGRLELDELQSERDFLRHAQLPQTSKPEKSCFLRIYRTDGSFGTIACAIDITTEKLLQMAARKFFAEDMGECRLVMLYPNRAQVLDFDTQPALMIRNMLLRAGYQLSNDQLSDVIRDDTSFLCRVVFVQGSEALRAPLLHQQSRRELVLVNTDVQDAPTLVSGDTQLVDTIDLSRSSFHQTVTHFPHLKRLRLSNMFVPFDSIPSQVAFNLQDLFTNLTFLDLSANGLTNLNVDLTFAPLLRYLDLRGNRLQHLPESIMHLPFLQVLECGTNALVTFKSWNPSLCRIGLSYNMLTQLDLDSNEAKQMLKLTALVLCANRIDCLPESLQKLPVLRELDVRYNLLSNPVTALTPTLTKLISSYNKPHMLDHRDSSSDLQQQNKLMQDCQILPRILELNVDNMANIDFYETYAMANISMLDMSYSNVSFLQDALFAHAPNLRVLNLAGNSLTTLPDSIANLRLLEELNVSKNSLVHIPSNIALLPELRILNVHANNLKTVSKLLLSAPKLKELNLSSNLLSRLVLGDSDDSAGAVVTVEQRIAPLIKLNLCDNQLSEEAFDAICQITTLQSLDMGYNYLTEIPSFIFHRLPNLEELYIAGNHISALPHDGFPYAKNLRILRANANRLNSLPAELSKATLLEVLDVGANLLRYNVANYPFDWNWRWNKELRYLNFSGNRRMEVRKSLQVLDGHVVDLGDFCVLPKLITLSLMDVTLTTNLVPFESNECRVRTFGSDLHHFQVGIAESHGFRPLGAVDLVVERFRNMENESLIALFDGENELPTDGNKISHLAQQIFPSMFKKELDIKGADPVNALRRAFLETHREIGNNAPLSPEEIAHTALGHRCSTAPYLNDNDWSAGTGATVVYYTKRKMYIATVGGAHVVLSRANGTHRVLSTPLKPVGDELNRIRASGGIVDCSTQLIDGISKFPRLIGCYTAGTVFNAAPMIYEYDVGDTFESADQVIIGSSAMWTVMGHETAADIARSSSHDSVVSAMKLRDFAHAYGCVDRFMTIVIGRPQTVDTKKRQISDGDIYMGDSLAAVTLRKRMEQMLPEDSTLARLGTEVSPPFGDVTMVFTDIRNSTYLWEAYPSVMRSAIKTHNSLMRRSIRLMDGYEVKNEGDAFIISFHTPIKALIWCLTVQQHLLTAEWPPELLEVDECAPINDGKGQIIFRGLSVRMGIHCGRPVAEPDPVTRRMDYFGPMVNRASRISGVAQGGQISVSADFLNVLNRTVEAHQKVQKGVPIGEAYNFTSLQAAEVLERSATLLAHTKYTVLEMGELKLRGIENLEHIYNIYPQQLAQREVWYSEQKRKEEENVNDIPDVPSIPIITTTTPTQELRRDSADYPAMPAIMDGLRRQSEVSLSSFTSNGSTDMLREQMLRELMLRKQVIREQMDDDALHLANHFDPLQSLAHRLEALCASLSGNLDLKTLQQTMQLLEPPVLADTQMAEAAQEIWLTRIENAVSRIQQLMMVSGKIDLFIN